MKLPRPFVSQVILVVLFMLGQNVLSQTAPSSSANSAMPTPTTAAQGSSVPGGGSASNIRQQPLRCQTFTGADRAARYLAAAEEAAKADPPWPCLTNYLTLAVPFDMSKPANEEALALARSTLAKAEVAWGPDSIRVDGFLSLVENLILGRDDSGELDHLITRRLDISKKAYGPEGAGLARALRDAANSYEVDAGGRANRCRSSRSAPEQCDSIMEQGYEKAEPFVLRAVGIAEKNASDEAGPRAVQAKRDLQFFLTFLARTQIQETKFAEAEATYQRVATLDEDLWGPANSEVVGAWVALGDVYEQQKDYAQAEATFQVALGVARQLSPNADQLISPPPNGASPVSAVRALSGVLDALARLSFEQGKSDQGRAYVQQAVDALANASDTKLSDLWSGFHEVISVYSVADLYADAQAVYLRLLSIEEADLSNSTAARDYPNDLRGYALLLRQMNKPDEAAKIDAQLKALQEKSATPAAAPVQQQAN
jgi:tetratricopeptide (TPR) repeat protein